MTRPLYSRRKRRRYPLNTTLGEPDALRDRTEPGAGNFFCFLHADSHMPCRAHAALCRGLKKSLSERHGRGMARVRHGMFESNTAAVCKSKGKTQSKPLAARHGRGTAWERHGMCELALKCPHRAWGPHTPLPPILILLK
jgi:hypothetical protein